MMLALCLFAVVGAFLAAALWVVTRQQRLELREQAWLPQELKGATLEFAERVFHAKWPFGLYAKVDRAYKAGGGVLVLTELKRRFNRRAYRSDVVELSAQKLAIERGARRSVAATGFVVVEHPTTRERTPIPVSLLRESELVALRRRYQRLVDGVVTPEKANDERLCRLCAHLDRCKPHVWVDNRAYPIDGKQTALQKIDSLPQPDVLNAAAAKAGRPARRRATGRTPGRSKTTVRSSPGSGRNHRT